jgi:hypothetical protein
MKRTYLLALSAAAAITLTACGGGDTYTTTGHAVPDEPIAGDALIISSGADNGSVSSVSYTTLEDGSILVSCNGGACGDISVGASAGGAAGTGAAGGCGSSGSTGSTGCN